MFKDESYLDPESCPDCGLRTIDDGAILITQTNWSPPHDFKIYNLPGEIYTLNAEVNALKSSEFEIYPNPTNDKITIKSLGQDKLQSYTIYDLVGNKITEKYGAFNNTISAKQLGLSPGSYYFILRSEKGTVSPKKFLVVK